MKKIMLGALLGAVFVAALAAGGWWVVVESGWVAFHPAAPHPANLGAAINRHLAMVQSRRTPQCATLDYVRSASGAAATPFEDSEFDFTPAGFRAVLKPNAVTGWENHLAKLQALAKHGLLASRALAEGGTEFTMTWEGLARTGQPGCFEVTRGVASASVTLWTKSRRDGVVVYEATARVTPGELTPWAQDAEFARAFGKPWDNALEPKTITYQLARGERGFSVISEGGNPVYGSGALHPSVVAMNVQRAGEVNAEKIKSLLQSALDGPMSYGSRVCLPVPGSEEADQVDLYSSGGAVASKESATFVYYNLVEQPAHTRRSALRGYEAMRKLEALGLAKSEQVPAADFRNIPASGAVRFTLNPDAVQAAYAQSRCLLAGTLAADEIVELEPIAPWKTSLRFTARLKLVPAGPFGEKAIASYGNLRRMSEAGVVFRHTILIASNGLSIVGGTIKQLGYSPDVSRTSLPVVIGEKAEVAAPKGGGRIIPVQVKLVQVLGRSRISPDGLTMVYSQGTTNYAKSSVARNTGKWYAEATLKTRPGATVPDTSTMVGVARNPKSDTEFIVGVPRAEAFNMRGLRQPVYDGEVIGIAFDADEGRAYFFRGGNWVSGPPGYPGAGVKISKSIEYVIFASSSPSSGSLGGDSWTLNFGNAKFQFPIPAGYLSWDGRLTGSAAKVAAAPAVAAAATQQPLGVEGAINRCRDRAGKVVYVQRPCASEGMEQLGVVRPTSPSRGPFEASGGDGIRWIDPATGSVQNIPIYSDGTTVAVPPSRR